MITFSWGHPDIFLIYLRGRPTAVDYHLFPSFLTCASCSSTLAGLNWMGSVIKWECGGASVSMEREGREGISVSAKSLWADASVQSHRCPSTKQTLSLHSTCCSCPHSHSQSYTFWGVTLRWGGTQKMFLWQHKRWLWKWCEEWKWVKTQLPLSFGLIVKLQGEEAVKIN